MTYNKTLLKEISKINKDNYKKSMDWDYVNYLDTGNLTENKIDKVQKIDLKTDKLPSRAKRIPGVNNILYSTVRPNQKHYGFIDKEPIPNLLVSTGFVVLEIDEDKANPKYVYYYLIQDSVINMLQNIGETSTSAYPSVKVSDIENIELNLPTLLEQEAIANILSSFDAKIENNNAVIANLEEQAQAVFKSWFIDFVPFQDEEFVDSELGRIPSDWRVVKLKEISKEIVTGKTPPTKDPENYGDKMLFITIPDMHNKVYVTNTERALSKKGIETQKNKIVPKNSIAVSCIATVGLVTLVSEDSQTNQQINTVITKDNISSYYVYNFLKTQHDYLNAIGSSGSTTKNVNKTTFSNLKVVLPNQNVLNNFHKVFEPMYEYILLLQKQNLKLSSVRDTLLPKLMSGEIRVEEAIEVE